MIAVVTGASSGIGREFVYQLDNYGFDEIWLIARRKDRLKEISKNLVTKTKILALDLLSEESFLEYKNALIKYNPQISLLINSAGIGYNEGFEESGLLKNSHTVSLNCIAVVKITSLSLDYMKEGSRIINLSSVASFLPQPNFSVYAASKSFVLSFSRSLSKELKKRGILVTALCPNPVKTEFFKHSEQSKIKQFANENLEKMVDKTLRKKNRTVITTHPISKIIHLSSKILPINFILWIEKLIGLY
ncbi:MAG: SDR family NAD(P)-dependent oxidoreductase [Tissierellia bacterium]|nr:SDR family NAD(P)-dependent oxidoreductase [Tissierellia bacterium]